VKPEATELRVQRSRESVAFWIHVTPRARRTAVGGAHGDALRVSVSAAPVGGAANAACARALAEALGIRRADVELAERSTGRRKRVRVAGDPAELARRLSTLARAGGSD
jgi:uncharacterized protein